MAPGAGALAWLEALPLAQLMRSNSWLYPAVEIVHIGGFVLLVGAAAMFDLRVLGFARPLPVQALGRHLLRWSLASVVLVVPAGLLMFSTHPGDFAANRVFWLKLALIALAGVNAALFHFGPYRSVASWDSVAHAPAQARLQAGLSLALWLGVICCGRLLAYT